MKEIKEIIIRKEQSLIDSIICDTYSFLSQVGVIGIGVYCNSVLMQWVGLITLCLFLICRACSTKRYSILEAIEELEKMRGKNGNARN